MHCQESVKILSRLIMQFLSINDIPPVPGETHPCTNSIWQLHHQQSLPGLQFSSEVNASCLGGADRPFDKREASEVSNLRQCDCPGSPKNHPVPPVGKEGNSSHFHLFRTKYIPVWGFGFFFHDVFYFLKIELKTLLFFWSRSYAVYSCPETGEPTGTPFMSVLNWRLSCNLILLLRQKGQYLFSRFSLSLYPLWTKKEMTES